MPHLSHFVRSLGAGFVDAVSALAGGFRPLVLSLGLLGAAGCGPQAIFDDDALAAASPISSAQASGPQKQVYEVVFGPAFPPFLLLDGKGGVLGYEVDLLNAIARVEGFRVKYSTHPWNQLFDNITSGKKDLVGSGITITRERLENFNFSNPIFPSRQLAFSLKPLDLESPQKMKAYKAIAQADTRSAELLKNVIEKTENVRHSKSIFLGVKEVLNDRADFIISDSGPLLHFKQQYANYHPVVHDFKELPTEYFGFAVSKYRQDDLIERVNDGLQKLAKSGELDEIYKKWFAQPFPAMPTTEELRKGFDKI